MAVLAPGCISSTSSTRDGPGVATAPVSASPAGTPAVPAPPAPSAMPEAAPIATPVPSPDPVPSVVASPWPGADEAYSRTYEWEYKNVRWTFDAMVQKSLYEHFSAKPRGPGIGYASYALAGEDRECLGDVARQFHQGGEGYGYTRSDDAANVVAFVQSLPYVPEGDGEYPRYPLETLVDGGGDCDDKAILAAALLHEMGFDVVLLQFPNHLAVGVNVDAEGVCYERGGVRYYYAETTGGSWKIGEAPAELGSTGPVILPMVKAPVVELEVEAAEMETRAGLVYYRVSYSARNRGPGNALGLELQVRALALGQGENVAWAPERTITLGDLADGSACTADVLLLVPSGERSRIVCLLSGDNIDDVQESTGEFTAG